MACQYSQLLDEINRVGDSVAFWMEHIENLGNVAHSNLIQSAALSRQRYNNQIAPVGTAHEFVLAATADERRICEQAINAYLAVSDPFGQLSRLLLAEFALGRLPLAPHVVGVECVKCARMNELLAAANELLEEAIRLREELPLRMPLDELE